MSEFAVKRHNSRVLADLEPGDLVEFKRGLYSHWAVYKGAGKVIHLAGDDSDGANNVTSGTAAFTICGKMFNKAVVREDHFADVVCGSKAYKNNTKDAKLTPHDREDIVDRAVNKLGEIGYNVLWKNCEHFAHFCRYGTEKSSQADAFFTWASIGVAAAAIFTFAFGSSRRRTQES